MFAIELIYGRDLNRVGFTITPKEVAATRREIVIRFGRHIIKPVQEPTPLSLPFVDHALLMPPGLSIFPLKPFDHT